MAKYRGEFWLKGEEDKRFLGEIKLGKSSSELSLIIPSTDEFDRGEFLKSEPRRPVIGVTTCGKRITLTDYFQTFTPDSFTGGPRSPRFYVNAAFVGPFNDISECDPEVDTAAIFSEPLVEWCGKSSHEVGPGQMFDVKYSPPEDIEIYRDAEFTIKLGFGAGSKLTRTGASIDDSARIEMKAIGKPLAWSRHLATLLDILDVVSIGCGDYSRVSKATTVSKDPLCMADYHFHPLFPDSEVRSFPQWLFTLRDLPESAFTKWMEKADALKRARALFFSAKHHHMFSETRIILLTQAVEAYCREVHEDDVKRGYLARHFRQLCKEYKDPISVVFSDRPSRVQAVLGFRDDQTHSLNMPTSYMTSDQRLAMEHFLCLVLELCFMSQLDIAIADMTRIVEHSWIYSQLKEHYS